ncbi:hypothetical protein [Sphingomonas sp. RT2P30]|uniref:hypothetical protein n=1 Tax=Parasphingomonas halimpatiens TaxID=3096162 RepID=UPI002FC66FB0
MTVFTVSSAAIPAGPLFPAVFVAVPPAVIPLSFDNSGINGKLLIIGAEIGEKIQHNSGENKKSR